MLDINLFIKMRYSSVSKIKGILDVMSDLLFLAQALLEMFYLLAEKVIHLEFFLHHILQFLHIRIDIEVYVADSLHFRNELTLLG